MFRPPYSASSQPFSVTPGVGVHSRLTNASAALKGSYGAECVADFVVGATAFVVEELVVLVVVLVLVSDLVVRADLRAGLVLVLLVDLLLVLVLELVLVLLLVVLLWGVGGVDAADLSCRRAPLLPPPVAATTITAITNNATTTPTDSPSHFATFFIGDSASGVPGTPRGSVS